MRSQWIDGMRVVRPTREDVYGLRVGDMAPDCFGNLAPILEITARQDDIGGKAFCCYYTAFGTSGGRISGSVKENEICPTVPLVRRWQRVDNVPWGGE